MLYFRRGRFRISVWWFRALSSCVVGLSGFSIVFVGVGLGARLSEE